MGQTINIAPAPAAFNRALRALGVTDVTVGEGRAAMGDEGVSQLINAVFLGHTKLIVAESHVSALREIRAVLTNDEASIEERMDAIERIDATIAALTGIATERT